MNDEQAQTLSPIADIIEDLRNGQMVVLVDDEDRENEGDLVLAADCVSAQAINFMAKHARGLICLTLTQAHAQRLHLSPMTAANGSMHRTNFTVSIEAASGVSTGISAADRAHTVRVAARPEACAADIVQPGHVFPIVAQPGGVLMRAGHTEAGCDLTALAGLTPAAVICEIMNDDGSMARLPDLQGFAKRHGLKVGTIADLIQYRAATESLVERVGEREIALPMGPFRLVAYRDRTSGGVHLALLRGAPRPEAETLVRVHEPLTVLDFFSVDEQAHSWPLSRALEAIAASECGVAVLLNCAGGADLLGQQVQRLFGAELQAPSAIARGATSQDLRTYGIGAQILRDLGVGAMRLLARERKMPSMTGFGLTVTGFVPGP